MKTTVSSTESKSCCLTKRNPLDLYAEIEPMIGFYDTYAKLYEHYLKRLRRFSVERILDIGCGNGTLLLKLQERYEAKGIDLSEKMVQIARSKGANAHFQPLEMQQGAYDALLAVADVLNYLDKPSLERFLGDVHRILAPGGVFLADINTRFGFEEVATGCLIDETPERFLAIDARFEDDLLTTDIALFEKERDLWRKSQASIIQYYHDVADIMERTGMKLLDMEDIALFAEEPDKTFLILQKEEI